MTIQKEIPSFGRLYVVSDLHFGGVQGHQIFCQGERLTNFINQLNPAPADADSTCLVLNGDIVDFLADKNAVYFDPAGAITKLDKVLNDINFKSIWKALEEFIQKPGSHLTIVLGNHDVELALPSVREWLINRLSQGKAEARGRITMALDGAGYRCSVGEKQVLCLHGNEVDSWNIVDYRALLDVSRSMNRGTPLPEWNANAGTRMVIDVMNEVKNKYPMIDLLKPENEAAVPLLLTMAPEYLKDVMRIFRLGKALGTLVKDVFRMKTGFLSAEEVDEVVPSETDITRQFLGEHFKEYYQDSQASSVADMLMQSHNAIEKGLDPKDEENSSQDAEFLGIFSRFKESGIKGLHGKEGIRLKLKEKLKGRRDFELDEKDETFEKLDEAVGEEIDYLIAGHTHLHRALERRGNKYYFNSGSWIRLIQLTDYTLENKAEFDRVYNAFKEKSLEALDKLNDLGENKNNSLILPRYTVVSILNEEGRTFGELRNVNPDGSTAPFKNSRLPRR